MEAWEAQDRPDGEETNHQFHHTARTFLNGLNNAFNCLRTQGDVCDDAAKYEGCQKRQRDDEAVEKAVIPFSHTVSHPWAVVIKPLHTVVTQAAVGGSRRAKHFTSEAVFELHHLLVDEDLLGSRRGAIRRGSWGIYLSLYVCSFVWGGPG